MTYLRIGPEERAELKDGRIAIVAPVEPPYPSTLRWKQVVRIEEAAQPNSDPAGATHNEGER